MDLAQIDTALATQFRAEAHGMAEAYLEALQSLLPSESVIAVYAKGSAYRPWDSVIDYVPELSDVDIHVRLTQDASAQLRASGSALDLAEAALSFFRRAFPDAAHTPRPQLFFLDELEKLPGYLASPRECVHTLFGPEYKAGTPSDYAMCQAADAERFGADARFVSKELPGKVIDRPGRLIWNAVGTITWRVGPAGPRLLTQLGAPPYDVWSWNRSRIIEELLRHDCLSVAQAYADFYLAGWDGFRSHFEDAAAGRRAVLAVDRLYAESVTVLTTRGLRASDV
jgi:hypothetical protein